MPVEPETNVIARMEENFGEYEVLYEKWEWDGIHAESLIFASQDLSELNDLQFEAFVRESPLVQNESKITIKREKDYVFVNFNFH